MKTMRRFCLECGRLLRSREAWAVLLLTLASPLAGLWLYAPATGTTMLSVYLANPALAGGVIGGLLFALLTVVEMDRAHRCRADVLLDAVASPLELARVRLAALLAVAVGTTGLALLLWLPAAALRIGAVFDGADYVLAGVLFFGFSLVLCTLAAAAAYSLTQRLDLSLVLVAAFAALSLTVWSEDWQRSWLSPGGVWALSDDFSNSRLFRSVAYARLSWLAALGGVWGLAYLCIRRQGRGLLGSLARSARRLHRPALALLLVGVSAFAYAAQPFYDDSNPDLSAMTLYEQEIAEGVVCTGRTADVRPNPARGTVQGAATYSFQNTSGQARRIAFGINPGYEIQSARANGEDVPAVRTGYEESNMALVEITIPADETVELVLEYGGLPQDWNLMTVQQGDPEISAEYLCLENQTLAPYLLNVAGEGEPIPAQIEITLPAHMTALPFGAQQAEVVRENADGTVTWRYAGAGPGGILYAGDYVREDVQAGGITVQLYYSRKHEAIMQQADAAGVVEAVVEYCTAHYGALSFGSTGTLKLIQGRVRGGGYAAAGASLLDEADFTATNLADGQKGAVPGEVMLHELVHQWWGLGNMFDVETADSPWSAEGLTVYTTYRIVKELYGEEYAQENYVDKWREAVQDYSLNFYVRHPEYLTALPEAERLRIENSLSTVRLYSEMPLKILRAQELVGGEEAMDEILRGLFNREVDWNAPYLTYPEFLDACGLTEEDLDLAQDLDL